MNPGELLKRYPNQVSGALLTDYLGHCDTYRFTNGEQIRLTYPYSTLKERPPYKHIDSRHKRVKIHKQ